MQIPQFVKALLRSILIGTFAGAWLPTVFTTVVALSILEDPPGLRKGLGGIFYLAAFPTLVSLCFVVPCAIIIGLPLTWLLRGMHKERPEIYSVAGGIFGAIVPATLLWASVGDLSFLLIFLGIFSGAVTGWIWGRERESLDDERDRYSPN